MLFETVKSEGIALLSYVIGDTSSGTCVVVDPRRDVDTFLELARRNQVRITHILETHIHADFVSGSRELAARTGAAIYGGASDAYRFPINQLREGDTIEVGSYRFKALHTPGHSPEHVCFLVAGGSEAEAPWGLFTGDTLFSGSVGRPDLATGLSPEALARDLWCSLKEKVLRLGDELLVFPAHGAGSPCGGNIGERELTSIGYERRHSPKLRVGTEDEFVERVLSDLPEEPFYYKRMKRLNAEGPRVLGQLPFLQPIEPRDFRDEMQKEHSVVLDTREITAFGGAHVPGALSIALRSSFALWAGWMLRPEQRILLVVDDPREVDVARRHLLRVGFENIVGYLREGINGWIEAGYDYGTMPQMSIHDLEQLVADGKARIQVVDARSDQEWESGYIPTARHIFTPHMADGGLDELDRGRPVAVYCGSGYRATIAASELKRNGFDKVYAVPGSMKSWRAAAYPLVGR